MIMKNKLVGTGVERMSDTTFWIMKQMFKIYYLIKPVNKYIKRFGIKQGDSVVDYGCGPGNFIRNASVLAGEAGIVYAVDVHESAISSVGKLIEKYNLKNVRTILAVKNHCSLPDKTADIIYAIDMFHMVPDTDSFLCELKRIIKPNGKLIIEDGHQPRNMAIEKINKSGCWKIKEMNKKFITCIPSY